MEKIIDPVDINLIKQELTPDKKLCNTCKAGNEIYVVDWFDSPNTVREIGRLREISFRGAGGSSGMSLDIDEFDTMEKPYKQMIIWDPDANTIIGGYRYLFGPDAKFDENGQPILATSHMFHFSDEFIKKYLPHTIELGRSFVTPEYQSSKAGAKALFALDNLWDGITTIIISHPDIMYFFGKMTMYPSYDRVSRDLILSFLWKHFPDMDSLIRPIEPIGPEADPKLVQLILKHEGFKEDYKLLKEAVRSRGTNIPPLVNSYMNTSPTLKMMGTAINKEFSDVEETAILVCFDEMFEDKRDRHMQAFISDFLEKAQKRFPQLSSGIEERYLEKIKAKRLRNFNKFLKRNEKSE